MNRAVQHDAVLCSRLTTNNMHSDVFVAAAHPLQWRTSFRKDMNRAEAQANNRAIDSLINYETVKYCGNEEHEVARYDECMAKYQVCDVRDCCGVTTVADIRM
jgi:ABC-type transport system involved in Fe-S cluster assembly fused permease/ATPase subunit